MKGYLPNEKLSYSRFAINDSVPYPHHLAPIPPGLWNLTGYKHLFDSVFTDIIFRKVYSQVIKWVYYYIYNALCNPLVYQLLRVSAQRRSFSTFKVKCPECNPSPLAVNYPIRIDCRFYPFFFCTAPLHEL